MTVKLMRGKRAREGDAFPDAEMAFTQEMEEAFDALQKHNDKARTQFADRLLAKMNARTLIPSRYTVLTRAEEKKRCEITWRQFDDRMWLAAFGTKDELKKWVADPQGWQDHKKTTQLLFSDQVPFWIKIGNRKTVFADWELTTHAEKKAAKKKRLSQHSNTACQDSQIVRNGTDLDAVEESLEGVDGEQKKEEIHMEEVGEDEEIHMKAYGKKNATADAPGGKDAKANDPKMQAPEQKRGGEGGHDKMRITLECRQGVRNYFDPDKDPEGYLLPTIVIMKGKWARLENIDDDHKWVKDESFWVGDEHIERQKGKGAGLTMYEMVEIRKKSPHLIKDLVIMQQPCAFVDEIIEAWIIQDAAMRVPQALHQRDLFGAALTDTCLKAMQLAQQIPCWIAPKMTPVLQLTDTDIAFILKRHADKIKADIAKSQRARARLAGDRCIYSKLGNADTISLVQKAAKRTNDDVKKRDTVLAGLRRNGMLAYRPKFNVKEDGTPDMQSGRFLPPDFQEWAGDKPIGGHRMLDEWCVDRTNWLNASGRPIPADWSEIHGATCEADLAELDYCSKQAKHCMTHQIVMGGKYIEIPVLETFADKQDMVPEEEMDDFLNPKQRRLKMQEKMLESKGKEADKKAHWRHQRYLERLKMKECLAAADASWRTHLNEEMMKATRKEILFNLQPGVTGKRDKKRQKKKDTLKDVKVKVFKSISKKINNFKNKMKGKAGDKDAEKDESTTCDAVIMRCFHKKPIHLLPLLPP